MSYLMPGVNLTKVSFLLEELAGSGYGDAEFAIESGYMFFED